MPLEVLQEKLEVTLGLEAQVPLPSWKGDSIEGGGASDSHVLYEYFYAPKDALLGDKFIDG